MDRHEIVGVVTAVGSEVEDFKVGQLAGVGCMVNSCRTCAHTHLYFEQRHNQSQGRSDLRERRIERDVREFHTLFGWRSGLCPSRRLRLLLSRL